MASRTEQQIITIHILSNISRTKGNQTMEFAQLIKYNVRNIFPQKSYRKQDKDTSSSPASAQHFGLYIFTQIYI